MEMMYPASNDQYSNPGEPVLIFSNIFLKIKVNHLKLK